MQVAAELAVQCFNAGHNSLQFPEPVVFEVLLVLANKAVELRQLLDSTLPGLGCCALDGAGAGWKAARALVAVGELCRVSESVSASALRATHATLRAPGTLRPGIKPAWRQE